MEEASIAAKVPLSAYMGTSWSITAPNTTVELSGNMLVPCSPTTSAGRCQAGVCIRRLFTIIDQWVFSMVRILPANTGDSLSTSAR